MITLFVPFKGLSGAKSRWGIPQVERTAKVLSLLSQNLFTISSVIGPDSTFLICPDALPLALTQVTRWQSPGLGLNTDLEAAREALTPKRREGKIGVILPDLPFLSAPDVHALIHNPSPTPVTLCPDHHGSGTNALLWHEKLSLSFLFEGESFCRHQNQAQSFGYSVRILTRPGLMHDADKLSDLEKYEPSCLFL